ncbi:hypothetical protein SAMN04488061_1610 [Filomicrobium insigne]|uniref:Uncharacterized protein n=1 Tax=Filomicrobium insigne TaxID=418854 RepID=A0A1H0M9A4_9HYPH|nr:hypothetical protein SAMN04488061_1610 [Filomicrobium insigne]
MDEWPARFDRTGAMRAVAIKWLGLEVERLSRVRPGPKSFRQQLLSAERRS